MKSLLTLESVKNSVDHDVCGQKRPKGVSVPSALKS